MMNTYTSHSGTRKSQVRGKSAGWAAFDLKHRQKQGLQHEIGKDLYPPMPSAFTSLRPQENLPRNNGLLTKSFSAVLLPSTDFPALTENKIQDGNSAGRKVIEENTHEFAFKRLKELHSWADSSLIEDVMASVDNDIDRASALLKEMVCMANSKDKETECDCTCNDSLCDKKTDKSALPKNITEFADDIANLCSTLENALKDNQNELRDTNASCGERLSKDTSANMKLILGHLRSIPIEPEWEEDDIYLSHRKTALKMMRSASQHSRAATNAFMRRDHFSARQHSLKAQEEWLAAERLNAKAAKEILSIRNSKNDSWTLDLHGLHAGEAVQAVKEHLQKIETWIPTNQKVSSNGIQRKNGIAYSPSLYSFSNIGADKQKAASRHRPRSLQVITGVGNHSRGQAALPAAVRNFLIENGYRFDEARPGVISVWPKFRHKRMVNQ